MLGFALPAAILLACASADVDGTPLEGQDPATTAVDGSANAGGDGSSSCTGTPLPRVDPTSLPSCCTTGAAHCAPGQFVPASNQPNLAPCPGGFCVPDKFIASGDTYVPPSCASLNGAQGVCLSVCIPQVAQYQAILPQDQCDPDERCAPCINPLTQQSSGACQLGQGGGGNCAGGGGGDGGSGPPPPAPDASLACPYTGPPIIDPTTLPPCSSDGSAHCLQASLVPPSEASKLGACPNNGGLCVPDVFIESGGNFIPKTCTSVGAAEGRCLNQVIPQVAAQASLLPVDVCQSFERCAPCFSPLDGSDTGACHLSCDPGPTKPAVVFKDCCTPDNASTTEGKCVPIASIPQSQQSDLATDECKNGQELCVPTEILEPGFSPPSCTADNFFVGNYSGVCLSTCLDFGLQGLGISQGNCDNIHECVPCVNPTNGQPTGAPGCAGADAGL